MAFNPMEHMMNLKGKDYLQVMWRLVWFREEHPDWCINTQLITHNEETQTAVFVAEIFDTNTRKVSTGWGSECSKDFHDYLEKAETKAVGRALAMLGYGTQFAPELDEGERIVDSPVPKKAPAAEKKQPEPATEKRQPKQRAISAMEKGEILREMNRTGITKDTICKTYGVQQIDDILSDMFPEIMRRFAATADKAS